MDKSMLIFRSFLLMVCLTLTAAVASSQSGGTIINQTYVLTPSAGAHCYLIATLVASSAGSYDHMHLMATLNPNWFSTANSSIDILMGNRNGFAYSYTLKGAQVASDAKLVAYENSDTSISVYIMFNDVYGTGSYTVLENIQDTAYSSPADLGSATPTGTLVFDSSSASYPPSLYSNFNANVGIGTTSPGAALEVNGSGIKLTSGSGGSITYADGSVQSYAWNGVLNGGDYAEDMRATGKTEKYEPGDVLALAEGDNTDVQKSAEPYSTLVAGIYATKPGVVGRRDAVRKSADNVPMAMIGVVPTKVSAENGPIRKGDLLVTASLPGYAMKGTDHSRMLGAVLGKAMGSLDSGTGVIEVLVTLQ